MAFGITCVENQPDRDLKKCLFVKVFYGFLIFLLLCSLSLGIDPTLCSVVHNSTTSRTPQRSCSCTNLKANASKESGCNNNDKGAMKILWRILDEFQKWMLPEKGDYDIKKIILIVVPVFEIIFCVYLLYQMVKMILRMFSKKIKAMPSHCNCKMDTETEYSGSDSEEEWDIFTLENQLPTFSRATERPVKFHSAPLISQ